MRPVITTAVENGVFKIYKNGSLASSAAVGGFMEILVQNFGNVVHVIDVPRRSGLAWEFDDNGKMIRECASVQL